MKNTQSKLKTELLKEEIQGTNLYYSLVKKDAQTLSFWTHERLLIYDDKRRILFYINDFENTPFKDKIPQPKNNSMPINLCNFSNPPDTNNLNIKYTANNSKGEMETTEWNFEFELKKVLAEWMNLLQKEKDRLVEKETGIKGASFLHDVGLKAMNTGKQTVPGKETILKPQQQVISYKAYQETKSDLKNSRLSNSNIKGNNSHVVPEQSNIRQSNKDPKKSDINSIQYSKVQPNLRNSNNTLGLPSDNKFTPNASGASELKPVNTSGIRNSNLGVSDPKPVNTSGIRNSNLGVSDPKPANTSGIRESNIRNSNTKPIAEDMYTFSENLRSKPEGPKDRGVDWNHRFLKESSEATLNDFEQEAMRALMGIWTKDQSSLRDPRRVYESHGLIIAIANSFTKQATLLKRQFRNYHFILQACKNKLIIGVPLCSLIEWQGVVALVKAPLPQQAEEVRYNKVTLEVRDLERYTRVLNTTLQKGTLWDLTNVYGTNGQFRMIYVDSLTQYLPIHLEEEMNGSSLRPQYMLDTVNHMIPGGDLKGGTRTEQKALVTACDGLPDCMKELVNYLNSQETIWVDALQLKQIFHNFGINFKLLPRIYNAVGSKHVKRYLQSVMAAKVAKDHLYDILLQNRKDDNPIRTQKLVQDFIKLLLEGNNSNSSELWKQINLKFKKQYSIPISNTEIIPGFFLNSFMKLMRIRADISRLDKGKKIFKEEKIVNDGFVVAIDPKIKGYYRFSTQFVEKIRYACRDQKKDHQIYEEIIQELQLKTKSLPKQYSLNNNQQPVLQYLTYYTPPYDLDPNANLQHIPIYQALHREPPSAFSLRITKSYLEWAIKKQKNQEFKKGVEESLKLSEFWLEDGHIFQTDLLQLLSDFYFSQGNYEESINFMKETLSKTIRTCGTQSRTAGNKFYELADRQLKAGRKKQALDSFYKAKTNFQVNKTESIKYPLLMMRIASLRLNSGDIEGCVQQSVNSIKKFDEYDRKSGNSSLTEGYKVKTFEILARAYQISSRRDKLQDMAKVCAKEFNSATKEWTYQQMTRICLAAAIFNNSKEKGQLFLNLCSKLQKQEESLDPSAALKDLMTLSQSCVVMQKFLSRFNSLERITEEGSSRKPMSQDSRDFLLICNRLTSIVGEDYIEGLVQQKQYE